MITKGILQTIDYGSNTCEVRLPLFENPGEGKLVFSATMSIPPGVYNGYKENDVVWVEFEDGHIDTPVVVGKLYLGVSKENEDPRGTINCSDSTTANSATIPFDTSLGIEVDNDVINTSAPFSNLGNVATSLDNLNSEVDRMDISYGNQFRSVIESLDGMSSEIKQTDKLITARVSKDSALDGTTEEFGWNLSKEDWSVYSIYSGGLTGAAKTDYLISNSHIYFASYSGYESTAKDAKFIENISYLYINGIRTSIKESDISNKDEFLQRVTSTNLSAKKTAVNITSDSWQINTDSEFKETGFKDTGLNSNQTPIMVVNKDGLFVNGNGNFTGSITAKDGHIGKFNIGVDHPCTKTGKSESGIYSDGYISSYEQTPEGNGVYVGTDGIKVGKYFSVDVDGEVTATKYRQVIGTVTEYAINNSATTEPDAAQKEAETRHQAGDPFKDVLTPPQTTKDNKYLWTRISTKYNMDPIWDNETYAVNCPKEVTSVEYRYKNNESGTTHPTDAWDQWSTSAEPEQGKYTWTWTKYKYTVGADDDFYSVTYTPASETTATLITKLGIPKDAESTCGLYWGKYEGSGKDALFVNASLIKTEDLIVTNKVTWKEYEDGTWVDKSAKAVTFQAISSSDTDNGIKIYDGCLTISGKSGSRDKITSINGTTSNLNLNNSNLVVNNYGSKIYERDTEMLYCPESFKESSTSVSKGLNVGAPYGDYLTEIVFTASTGKYVDKQLTYGVFIHSEKLGIDVVTDHDAEGDTGYGRVWLGNVEPTTPEDGSKKFPDWNPPIVAVSKQAVSDSSGTADISTDFIYSPFFSTKDARTTQDSEGNDTLFGQPALPLLISANSDTLREIGKRNFSSTDVITGKIMPSLFVYTSDVSTKDRELSIRKKIHGMTSIVSTWGYEITSSSSEDEKSKITTTTKKTSSFFPTIIEKSNETDNPSVQITIPANSYVVVFILGHFENSFKWD